MKKAVLTGLVQAIPLPALLIGQDERIRAANARAEALLGAGITGRHFITALRQPDLLDAVEGCLRTGTARTTRYLGQDGAQDTTFIVSCAPVDMGKGHVALVTLEDITHVEQVGQMRRDFVANVSHELRSPLTALLGMIETLQGPARGDPAASDRFLGIMQTEATRMERLVHDLLSLSRVEGQERERPTSHVDLGPLIGAVLHRLGPVAQDAQVALSADLPDAPVIVPADADQIQQVITNLVENAIKYGGAGGRVDVSLRTTADDPAVRGPAAAITVADQGPGIDPVHISRLTERFYRVDNHRSREMGGTGLGLAIVKHILNRHRGRLRITSAPGEGSTFRVVLPMGSAARTADMSEETAPS